MENFSEEQMKKLADMIAGDLTKRIYGVSNAEQDQPTDMMWYADRDDDHCVGELARLMTLMNIYEEREEYEKCHLINKHIVKLEKIVENL
tara:strand:- start:100 stop:369 length:270 start_codon:yes stop_codon:yes gene_type:complete